MDIVWKGSPNYTTKTVRKKFIGWLGGLPVVIERSEILLLRSLRITWIVERANKLNGFT